MKLSISVVIPNYNGKHLLEKNLPSLYSSLDHSGLEYEIIVPDDASTDGSIAFLKERYPAIKVIESKGNEGFSKNINKGFYLAQNDLVLSMNTDVSLDKNYFAPLLRYFEKDDTFGVMGSIYSEDRHTLQDAAKFPGKRLLRINTSTNYALNDKTENIPSLFLSGANALMDRKKLMMLEGMETLYSPFYYEDTDLGLRAWKSGWACYYEPTSICYHPNSETIKKHSSEKTIKLIARRNRLYFHAIHLEGARLALWYCILLINAVFRLFTLDITYYKSLFWFFRTLPEVSKVKKKNRKLYGSLQGNNISTASVIERINTFAEKNPHRLF